MRGRSLAVLCVVTAVLVAAAVLAVRQRAPDELAPKELLFPELRARVNDVAQIRVEGKGRGVTLVRDGERWMIREADNYPALFEKVRQVAVGFAELRLVDRKTGNPEYYSRLGVEDPAGAGANSMLVALLDASGGKLAELIVGRNRMSAAPGGAPGLYVRFPGEPQALLVEGRVEVTSNAFDWFERDLFDIAAERIRLVEVAHADGERVRVERGARGADLALIDLPAGKELKSPVVVSRMGTILEGMFADGVRAEAGVQFPADAAKSTILAFDGLVAEAAAARVDGDALVKFSFRFDPLAAGETAPPAAEEPAAADAAVPAAPDVAAEVAALNARLAGWYFEVPDYRFELFTRRIADLVQDEGKAAAAIAPAAE
jgi:hypothetical protein